MLNTKPNGIEKAAIEHMQTVNRPNHSAFIRLSATSLYNNCFNAKADMKLLAHLFGYNYANAGRGTKHTEPAFVVEYDDSSRKHVSSSPIPIDVRWYKTAGKRGEHRMSIQDINKVGKFWEGDLLMLSHRNRIVRQGMPFDRENPYLTITNVTTFGASLANRGDGYATAAE
jgi:hypothetical protein